MRMPLACIDVGSNTIRLLVADGEGGRLRPLLEVREFIHLGAAATARGAIPVRKVRESAAIVAEHARSAREAGASQIAVVGTAAVRAAPNRSALVREVRTRAGLELRVLTGAEEARLAFAGAASGYRDVTDALVVLDVGGGSTEVAVGTVAHGVSWWRSFAVGTGTLAHRHLRSDPPTSAELAGARREVADAFADLQAPAAEHVLAVGGSATSLGRLIGRELVPPALAGALHALAGARAAEVAASHALDPARVRLLPAGVIVLEELSRRLGVTATIACGGLREGVVLELAAAAALLGSNALKEAS